MKNWISKSTTQLLVCLSASAILTGFGSCSPHIEEACRKQIPEFQKNLETARLEIKADYPRSEGRALASLDTPLAKNLTAEDIRQWQHWAEERLKEVQNYMDVVHGEAKVGKRSQAIQDELAHAANDFVTFDGFAEKKKTRLMLQVLESAQKHTDTAVRLACSAL